MRLVWHASLGACREAWALSSVLYKGETKAHRTVLSGVLRELSFGLPWWSSCKENKDFPPVFTISFSEGVFSCCVFAMMGRIAAMWVYEKQSFFHFSKAFFPVWFQFWWEYALPQAPLLRCHCGTWNGGVRETAVSAPWDLCPFWLKCSSAEHELGVTELSFPKSHRLNADTFVLALWACANDIFMISFEELKLTAALIPLHSYSAPIAWRRGGWDWQVCVCQSPGNASFAPLFCSVAVLCQKWIGLIKNDVVLWWKLVRVF